VFEKVDTPRINIYDSKTNEYYGRANFPVTTDVEDSLLQIVNYGRTPEQIILQDITFLSASSKFVPP